MRVVILRERKEVFTKKMKEENLTDLDQSSILGCKWSSLMHQQRNTCRDCNWYILPIEQSSMFLRGTASTRWHLN